VGWCTPTSYWAPSQTPDIPPYWSISAGFRHLPARARVRGLIPYILGANIPPKWVHPGSQMGYMGLSEGYGRGSERPRDVPTPLEMHGSLYIHTPRWRPLRYIHSGTMYPSFHPSHSTRHTSVHPIIPPNIPPRWVHRPAVTPLERIRHPREHTPHH